jgi:hypothetical protein
LTFLKSAEGYTATIDDRKANSLAARATNLRYTAIHCSKGDAMAKGTTNPQQGQQGSKTGQQGQQQQNQPSNPQQEGCQQGSRDQGNRENRGGAKQDNR